MITLELNDNQSGYDKLPNMFEDIGNITRMTQLSYR